MTVSSSPLVAAMAWKRSRNVRWTPAEDRVLRAMRESGADWDETAAAIPGRTRHACATRASRLLSPEPAVSVAPGEMAELTDELASGPEWLVYVTHEGWRWSVARGDREEMERIGASLMASHPGQVTIEEVAG